MVKKVVHLKLRFYIIFFIILGIVSYFLVVPSKEKIEIKPEEKTDYILVSKDNVYIVYLDKFTLKIPNDTSINKEKKIKNILSKKNYLELQNSLNYLLSEKVKKIKIADNSFNENQLNNLVEVPLIELNNEKLVDSFELGNIFVKEMYKFKVKKKENIIDILNGNGIGGSAGKLGNKISKKFGYKYTAANHAVTSEFSYIINNKLSKEELEELILGIDLKYIKIKEKGAISTLADAVIIIGREKRNVTTIKVRVNSGYEKKRTNILKNNKYRIVKRYKAIKQVKSDRIEYNEEDYFIALKIGKLLGINNLIVNNKLKNIIEVLVKE